MTRMTRMFQSLHLTPLLSATILAAIFVGAFGITSHAGGALISVAHAAGIVDPAPVAATVVPSTPGLDWTAYLGLALTFAGGLLTVINVLLGGLRWLAPRTKTTIDDTARDDLQLVHDKLDAGLKLLTALVPATGVPTSLSASPTVPSPTAKPGFARVAMMLMIAGIGLGIVGGMLVSCAATKMEAKSIEAGIVTCAKADKPAVQATALQLSTEAAGQLILTGKLDWAKIKTDAEAAGEKQGVDVASCAFSSLLVSLDALLHPTTPGVAVSALTADAFGDPVDPLADGRAAYSMFIDAHGITRVVQ